MNYKQAELFLIEHCQAHFEKSELQAMMKRIAEHLTQKTLLDLRLDPTVQLDDVQVEAIVAQLQSHKPLQYILGHEWFGHLKLNVNEHVLIPRPETEELVHWIKADLKTKQSSAEIHILDIGTGSGCIPIWLKTQCPSLHLTALDVSTDALTLAAENAQLHKADIQFVQADILDVNLNLEKQFDILISNPPYITIDERATMDLNVLDFEPNLALFVSNDDALQFYKAILHFSTTHLKPNGVLYFEVGKQHAYEVQSYFNQQGKQTELRSDMYGNERMLKVW